MLFVTIIRWMPREMQREIGKAINEYIVVVIKSTVPVGTSVQVQTVIQEELETRKTVDRAKEILIKRRGMEVDEAYRWIQKRSMDSRKSIRNIAEAILLSEEIYNEK